MDRWPPRSYRCIISGWAEPADPEAIDLAAPAVLEGRARSIVPVRHPTAPFHIQVPHTDRPSRKRVAVVADTSRSPRKACPEPCPWDPSGASAAVYDGDGQSASRTPTARSLLSGRRATNDSLSGLLARGD